MGKGNDEPILTRQRQRNRSHPIKAHLDVDLEHISLMLVFSLSCLCPQAVKKITQAVLAMQRLIKPACSW